MEKLPFSPQGVQDLLSQIYALPQAQLRQEAAAASANFRLWLSENFELTTTQLAYLESIDNAFIAIAAAEVNFFITGRLPIILIKEEQPLVTGKDEPGDRGKLIDLDKVQKGRFSSEDGYSLAYSLIFKISYQSN
ncbi:hypothetical protein [Pedobacter agri]|uniref:Uncharacterized protein n=1 Tax=Pedobacter agri TaxID=454586 RepID=A0A9X3DGD7_9SPHI|nr:hypothetical protein [Pedobacter agri]MCX3265635.1 hypothetical protein [Pedobacter agri]